MLTFYDPPDMVLPVLTGTVWLLRLVVVRTERHV